MVFYFGLNQFSLYVNLNKQLHAINGAVSGPFYQKRHRMTNGVRAKKEKNKSLDCTKFSVKE
jgi:hypothetical protein